MNEHHGVEIELRRNGKGRILLDGTDISRLVSSVKFSADVAEGATLLLGLPHPMITLTADGIRVDFTDDVEDLLCRMGWTPPQDGVDG